MNSIEIKEYNPKKREKTMIKLKNKINVSLFANLPSKY